MKKELIKIAKYLGNNGFYEEAANLKKLASDMEDQGEETIPDFDKYLQEFAFSPGQADKLPEFKRVDGHGNIKFKVWRTGSGDIPLRRMSDGSISYSSFGGGELMMQKYYFTEHSNPRLVSVNAAELGDPGTADATRGTHIGDVSKVDAIKIWNLASLKSSERRETIDEYLKRNERMTQR